MPETQTVASVRRHAHPEAVEAEWRAQVERAQKAGIDVTHLDTASARLRSGAASL